MCNFNDLMNNSTMTMYMCITLLFFIGLMSFVSASTDQYRGCKVYRFTPPTISPTDLIQELEQSRFFDTFQVSTNSYGSVEVMVYPEGEDQFQKIISKYQLNVKLVNSDVEGLILRAETENNKLKTRKRRKLSIESQPCLVYLSFDEMKKLLDGYAERFEYATLEDIGKTVENRSLLLIKISKNDLLPIIWINAGIHAREWISESTALCFIDKLLTTDARDMLESFQFYIAPNINPDGYEFSRTNERLWRKNRAPSLRSSCFGVDLNRNFPYKWGGTGTSSDPCSFIYKGESPGDQLETKAFNEKFKSIKEKIQLFISVHSYGQLILLPYSYQKGVYPPAYKEMMEIASKAIRTIMLPSGRGFYAGSSPDVLYASSGDMLDYAVGTLNISYGFTFELPDRGHYGFVLPPSFIPEVGKEFTAAMQTISKEITMLI